MKILVAILSCHKRPAPAQVQRETWLRDATVDHRFFIGRPKTKDEGDRVFLDVPDDIRQQPLKQRAMVRWALERDYDFVFKCDDDTYVRVDRLLASGFEKWQYSGFVRWTTASRRPQEVEHAQGGAGYWLGREAMSLIWKYDRATNGAEDVNVALCLARCGVLPVHDPRYRPDMETVPTPENDQITAHDCGEEDLRTIHSRFA